MFVPMIYLLNWAGEDAWYYLWAFLSGLVLFFNMIYPPFIAPLFNKFGPITDKKIAKGIDDLIQQTGLTCKKVFEVDGSQQSSYSNAYIAGLCGTKRIVIYDTLIKDFDSNVDHINAVVGHEIGHSIMHHTWAQLLVVQAQFFVMF